MERKRKQTAANRRPSANTKQRILLLMVIFGAITFVTLFGKLCEIMIFKHETYENRAIANQTRDVSVSANRGAIYDAKGDRLAISSKVHNLILSPQDVAKLGLDQAVIAQGLSDILGLDRADVLKRMEKTYSAYEVVATKLEDDKADEVRKFIVDNKLKVGLYLVEDSKRYYPYSSLASQVIGFVNYKNEGSFGLESVYNDTLSGVNGRVVTAKNGNGTEMISGYEAYVDAEDGYNLNLTIDASVQYLAEGIVKKGIETFDVQNGGFCVVMNPKTGAVLAMVSYPNYDLNNPSEILDSILSSNLNTLKNDASVSDEEYTKAVEKARDKQWSSKALNEEYEPGSTFKPIVVAAALEEGKVQLSDTFYCKGSVKLASYRTRLPRSHPSADELL